ncbi:MAG: site-specific integrase, partial [Pseudomonadota bacterium]
MASIRQRNGKWQVQIRRKGHKPLSRSFDTKTAAKQWARQAETGLELGRIHEPKPIDNTQPAIFRELLSRYLLEEIPKKKARKSGEPYWLSKMLAEPLADKKLSVIRTIDFAEYRDNRLESGMAPASVKRELSVFHRIFELACKEWGMQIANPVSNLSMPRVRDARNRRLEGDEFERLLSGASCTSTPCLREIIVFAVETGMRRGEILALRWRDVVTRPRQRSHSLCKHGAAPGGRLIWLEPPHIGGQISRDNRFWGWGLVA